MNLKVVEISGETNMIPILEDVIFEITSMNNVRSFDVYVSTDTYNKILNQLENISMVKLTSDSNELHYNMANGITLSFHTDSCVNDVLSIKW
jgi:hypothetical protein